MTPELIATIVLGAAILRSIWILRHGARTLRDGIGGVHSGVAGLRRDMADLRERMARVEGKFAGYIKRQS